MIRQSTEERASRIDVELSKETMEQELNAVRSGARKIIQGAPNLYDKLSESDKLSEGLLGRDILQRILEAENINQLTQNEIDLIIKHADITNKGYINYTVFLEKLQHLVQESKNDVVLRRFANTVKH